MNELHLNNVIVHLTEGHYGEFNSWMFCTINSANPYCFTSVLYDISYTAQSNYFSINKLTEENYCQHARGGDVWNRWICRIIFRFQRCSITMFSYSCVIPSATTRVGHLWPMIEHILLAVTHKTLQICDHALSGVRNAPFAEKVK